MLTAMLIAGLVTAVAIPVYVMTTAESEDDTPERDPARAGDALGAALDLAPLGAQYDVPAAPGVVAMDGFVPGIDTLTLHVASKETEFMVLDDPAGGVSLHYDIEGYPAEVRFPGLDVLPDDDIRLVFPEASGALVATDPAEPEVLDAARDVSPGPVKGAVIDITQAANRVIEVSDYRPGQDVLNVTLTADIPDDHLDLSISASFDGEDGLLIANGKLIAVLPGVPDARLDDMLINVVRADAA
ncbi:MAG: hypothetical protein AAFY80_13055 [Pseudomonadota bacterium]